MSCVDRGSAPPGTLCAPALATEPQGPHDFGTYLAPGNAQPRATRWRPQPVGHSETPEWSDVEHAAPAKERFIRTVASVSQPGSAALWVSTRSAGHRKAWLDRARP